MINFVGRRITLQIDGEYTEGGFIGIRETTNKLGGIEQSSSENRFHIFGLVSSFPLKPRPLTACPGQRPTEPIVTLSEDTLVKNEKGGSCVNEKNNEQLIEGEVDILIPRRVGDRDEYVESASRYTGSCRSCHSNDLSALAKDKEGHTVADCSAT